MRQWEHGGIPCAPDLFLLPTPGSRPPAAGNICLSSPHAAGGGTSSARRQACGKPDQTRSIPRKGYIYRALLHETGTGIDWLKSRARPTGRKGRCHLTPLPWVNIKVGNKIERVVST